MSKNYNTTLQTNNSSLEDIITQLNNMPDAEEGLDTSDATATVGDILSGKTAYVQGKKITGDIPMVEVTEPIILVDQKTGKITAIASQGRGYTTGAIKTTTKQLAFQAAQTITPGTTDQTAVAANTYTGGVITVKGDANLIASNIVSGKSIFGVVGTATAGGSGGDTSMEDAFVARTLTSYTNDRVTTIGLYAFYYCSKLTNVSFPKTTSIGSYAFRDCTSLTSVSFPEATSIGSYAFGYCSKLTNVSFPKTTSIGSSAFYYCSKLTSVSFPEATNIGSYAFGFCSKLTSLSFPKVISIGASAFSRCSTLASIYLGASTLCTLSGSNAFLSTAIWSNKGSIFVPASLLASYKAATNWAFFSARIFSYNFT